jgi:hypothetical protein
MKHIIILGVIGLVANALSAADANPKEKVTNAAKQVGDKAKLQLDHHDEGSRRQRGTAGDD